MLDRGLIKERISQLLHTYRSPATLAQALFTLFESSLETVERRDHAVLAKRFCEGQHPGVEPSGLYCGTCHTAITSRLVRFDPSRIAQDKARSIEGAPIEVDPLPEEDADAEVRRILEGEGV